MDRGCREVSRTLRRGHPAALRRESCAGACVSRLHAAAAVHSDGGRHVIASLLVGYLSGAAALALFSHAGASLLLLGIAAAPVTLSGFGVGRVDGQASSALITGALRRALVFGLGLVCAIVSLPVGVRMLAVLSGAGIWQVLASGLWFLLAGGIAGYLYGPMFRAVARHFPATRTAGRAG